MAPRQGKKSYLLFACIGVYTRLAAAGCCTCPSDPISSCLQIPSYRSCLCIHVSAVTLNMPSYMTRYPKAIEIGKNYLARTMPLVKATGVYMALFYPDGQLRARTLPPTCILDADLSLQSSSLISFFIDSGKVRLSWTSLVFSLNPF